MAINRTEHGIEFTDRDLIKVSSVLAGWKSYVQEVKDDTPASMHHILDDYVDFADKVNNLILGDPNG